MPVERLKLMQKLQQPINPARDGDGEAEHDKGRKAAEETIATSHTGKDTSSKARNRSNANCRLGGPVRTRARVEIAGHRQETGRHAPFCKERRRKVH